MDLTLPEWPMFGLAEDMRPALRAAVAAGEAAALVTLYRVEGGGPRPPGAQMLLSEGVASGFLSGGCVEADVALHAAETIADGEPRRLVYGEGGPWPDIRLLCGARIEILVERTAPDDPAVARLLAEQDARRPVVWITDGRSRRVEPAPNHRPPDCVAAADPFELRRLYEPVPRLVVVGADPIALATASLGAQAGFETTLVRPKGPQAPPPLAGVAYSRAEPAQALAAVGLDPWTAVAVATHDWDTDQAALVEALPSPAPYVGVLGARRRLPERLMRLREAGLDEASLSRLKAPIGLDLGGKAPWEVAVSVIAEIIAGRARDGAA
ncbi:MAG: XdhC family protein [Caulobacteraceae bacterium]|nr:XdhC family protein [Caulobacteraceae bacterium]